MAEQEIKEDRILKKNGHEARTSGARLYIFFFFNRPIYALNLCSTQSGKTGENV
jgi:hypothetical protein